MQSGSPFGLNRDDPGPSILWDTLEISAQPLQGRCDLLVVAHLQAEKRSHDGYGQYRVQFELDRHHGLVSHEVLLLTMTGDADRPIWMHSTRRDLALAVRDRFLKTQLYTHLARQL